MVRILYFAGGDNWACKSVMARRFHRDHFFAVQATSNPKAFYDALARNAPLDLVIIGTHGAPAAFLLIEGTSENATQCDVSYAAGGNRSDAVHLHPADFGRKIAPHLNPGARISIISCSVAGGADGKTFVMALSAGCEKTVTAADHDVSVEVVGGETVNIKVNGGETWTSTAGAYPQISSHRGRYNYG